ncbi:MAG TPA: ZIP family metal transporter [Solirubrobacterales bacterium]|jgi:ZIP family zinc transporter
MLTVVLAGAGTALATGLGVIPVYLLGHRVAALRPMLFGIAGGVMSVASIVGLLRPALGQGAVATVAAGLLAGVLFLIVTRLLLQLSDLHVGRLRGADVRTAVLVFAVLFAHSLPEGFAIGTAYASDPAGIGLFVIVAIAIQNIPEGTSVAIPMEASGFGHSQQFWAAVGTSAPQPIGALIAFVAVEQITALLPFSFAFAAGAMLALVAAELAPPALAGGWQGAAGLAGGTGLMLGLSALLNV